MSLTGNAEANYNLRGHIAALDKIHGYSAYEIAVINGFEGTEEEWLASLRGADGKDGYGAIVDNLTTGSKTAALSANMGKQLEQNKVPTVCVDYTKETKYAEDLDVPLALIRISDTVNVELWEAFKNADGTAEGYAYVRSMFYYRASKTQSHVQIAYSYRYSPTKMAIRTYNSNALAWTPWRAIAGTDVALLKADKPSGSYIGTGGAINVSIGGIGEAVLITSKAKGWSTIVVRSGAISIGGGNVVGHTYQVAQLDDTRTMRLNTSHAALNESGIEYEYLVL